jgi:hypothetical protein
VLRFCCAASNGNALTGRNDFRADEARGRASRSLEIFGGVAMHARAVTGDLRVPPNCGQ